MLAFLSYNGSEPNWATALRESNFPGLGVYSPALTLESQLESIGDELSARKPNALAYASASALRLEDSIWLDLSSALEALLAADTCTNTSQMIWRDIYLLVRADALIVDARSTNELAFLATLLGIRVIAISHAPTGLHPWLTYCAQITVNSPENVSHILDALVSPVTPSSPAPEKPSSEESGSAE